jgi:hypothetical protein
MTSSFGGTGPDVGQIPLRTYKGQSKYCLSGVRRGVCVGEGGCLETEDCESQAAGAQRAAPRDGLEILSNIESGRVSSAENTADILSKPDFLRLRAYLPYILRTTSAATCEEGPSLSYFNYLVLNTM